MLCMIKLIWLCNVSCLGALLIAGCHSVSLPGHPSTYWQPDERTIHALNTVKTVTHTNQLSTNKPLTLVELADFALENNPGISQVWQEARASAFRLRQAQSAYMPSVEVSGKAAKTETDTQTTDGSNVDFMQYGPQLTATWLLLDFGGRKGGYEEALYGLIASNFTFNQTIQDILLSVENNYYNLYSAREAEKAAQVSLEQAQKSLDAAREKKQAGLATKLDVLQATSDYDQARYNLEETKAGIQNARALLANILGISPAMPYTIAEPTDDLPANIDEKKIDALIETALAVITA